MDNKINKAIESFGYDGIHIIDEHGVDITKTAIFTVDGFSAKPAMVSPRLTDFREHYGFSDHIGIEIIRAFKLKIPDDGRVLIVGSSGTGKTTILRAIKKSPQVVDLDSLVPQGKDAETPIVELVGKSLDEALSYFASVGLADALALANTYDRLSDGQKYRYLIARGLSHPAKIMMADRFFENLDDTNCRVIGYLLARKCQKQGKTLIVATVRKEVEGWLNPNVICRTSLGNAPEIETRKDAALPEKPDFGFKFDSGKLAKEFNQYLGPYHYKSRNAPFPVFTVLARLDDGTVAAGTTLTAGPLNLRARGENVKIPREWITSQKTWMMSRVVVRPEFRGLGLGKQIVNEFFDLIPKDIRFVEIIAAMSKRHPFLEQTAFKLREFGSSPTAQLFHEEGFSGAMTDKALLKRFSALPEEKQKKLRESAGNKRDSMSLVSVIRAAMSSGGIYGYWVRPDLKDKIEVKTGDDKEFRVDRSKCGTKQGKLSVGEMIPSKLREVTDEELLSVNRRLHQIFGAHFAGNRSMTAGDLNREDVVNAALFVWAEMRRRGMEVNEDSPLAQAADDLAKGVDVEESDDLEQLTVGDRELIRIFVAKRLTAPIHAGTDNDLESVKVDQVVNQLSKPIILRSPAVTLVGSTVTQGESKNDVDLLVHGPLDAETRRVVEFRLGRALDPAISERAQFHDEALGGPFTDHVSLYDLVLVPRRDRKVVVEMIAKQDDPLMTFPPESGPRPGVVQVHTRGESAHLDLRLDAGSHLIGWTLFAQHKGGVPDTETTRDARALYDGYTGAKGNGAFKPLRAPAKLQATPKLRQPKEWLDIEGQVVGEGEVGATANEKGVIVAVAKPKVEWGLQLPHFHEYFLSGDKVWAGVLFFRMLLGAGGEGENRTDEGKPFWTTWQSKSALPSVLSPRAVEKGHMPPPGHSAMPQSLMDITPKEFRFWEAKSEESARSIRDALVKAKFFTEGNVAVVDGQYRRLVKKAYLYDGSEGDVVRKRTARYTLSWLFWRGPMQVRTGPSRQVWLFMFDGHGSGLEGFELQSDPRSGTTAAIRKPLKGKGLLAIEQQIRPGESIEGNVLNDTKETPAWLRRLEHGEAEVIEESDGKVRLRIPSGRLKGEVTFTAEEKGSNIWTFERATETKKGPRSIENPHDRFRPMKPTGGPNIGEFQEVEDAVTNWAMERLEGGVAIEPKWNGVRCIAARDAEKSDGEKVTIWFEDSQRERAHILPGITETLDQIDGNWVIDCELLDHEGDGTAKPRASLARFTGNVQPQDDSDVVLHVFRLLYWESSGKDLTQRSEAEAHHILQRWAAKAHQATKGSKHLAITERRIAHNVQQISDHIRWARAIDGSEGAMMKDLKATYSLDGATKDWVKLKSIRRVQAIVVDKVKVSGSSKTYNYTCAVGPIKEGDGFAEKETVEYRGKLWALIGKTGNTSIQAEVGDIVQVSFFELQVTKKPGERRLHWFGPPTVELLRDDLKMPTSVQQVESMATPSEVRKLLAKYADEVRIVKGKDEQYVLGIVLEPNDGKDGAPLDPDSQSDIYSKEEVRQAAYKFMEEYRNVGFMHRMLVNGKVKILESFIVPDGTGGFMITDPKNRKQHIREGTWLLGLHIVDKDLWAQVKADKLKGLSIGGSARRVEAKLDN